MAVDALSAESYGNSQRPDPHKFTKLSEILSCLSSLQSEEAELSSSLAELLASQEPVINSLARLQSLGPTLDELHAEASVFDQTVSRTAKTADEVGGFVRTLDEEMRRVREAAERVGQVMELKTSLNALQSAMEAKDWESATRHCSRAMSLPTEVISGLFAETAVPTPESHLPPAQTLHAAREELLAIFRREFDKASQSRDAAATSRFFKLFPAIGWELEGLQAYAAFVVDLVRVRAPASAKTSSPLFYITALTALFESIAMIVDQHQPIVEKYYGPGKMTPVIERLLQESDRVVNDMIEGWVEERAMERKLSDTSNTSRKQPSQYDADEEVDPREIDKVLTEAAGMSGRWSLFRKFMYDRLKDDYSDTDVDGEEKASDQSDNGEDKPLPDGLRAIEASASKQHFEDMLTAYYVPLESWYARSALDKVHRLSSADLLALPAVTTTPDDAFYILKAILNRLLSCGSLAAVQRTAELLRDVVDKEYTGVIKRKLDDVYRTAGPAGTRGDKAERENRLAFIVLLNDLDISSGHMERLVKELSASSLITQFYLDSEVEGVRATVASFNGVVTKFRSALRAGIEQLFNQLMRPRLRTFISDVYKDVSYVIDEDSYAQAGYNDVVRKRFVKSWETLVDGYKDTFTENNYRLLFGLALDVLVRPWERFISTLRYSELGAIRFDQDLRAITSYLSSQTAFGDVREKFVRLQQISQLLNLDSEEDADEFYNGSGIAWQLGEQEARNIVALRV
ncbi:COG4 transport protein-domain-containing protein [Rhodofomes roseus]|uniref:Conserved oligomeric Golgi complex subunit 4 n=2 Tax=Rhodofomes roseus TaxID=34475 RepID=A0ABQ8K2M2_9APHY|nr:COG4 transport protein-domain-containing protein [Rhodofomes roseus]KAH9831020.1 COG4 transport protein-domain-containing protein [Rhodofomes roseus]